jgi:GNAT superfamily N-acetyltransferase
MEDMNFSITVSDQPDAAARTAIARGLGAYNRQQTRTDDYRPLAALLTNSDSDVVGGLWGNTAYGWLFVELLFVPETLRGQRIGTELMQRAEREAMKRGCHSAWLDTFQFQARGFYERNGYACFGELEDFPRGQSRYFMKKGFVVDARRS